MGDRHQRQVAYSVNAPPMSGPQAIPIWPSDTFRPKICGNLCEGIITDRMVKMPFMRPEAPKPAMARPTISIDDDCAVPQSVDPNSKTVKKARNDHYDAIER